jgi:hypothetical protein
MGCALLWASACGVAPEEGLQSEEAAVQRGWTDEPAPLGAGIADKDTATAAEQACDRGPLQLMEEKARTLAQATGCTDVSQCQSAPLGALACGGPRDYVVYCSATTDERALQRTLRLLELREDRYNQRCNVVSICLFVLPPSVELVNGVCTAAAPELPIPPLP